MKMSECKVGMRVITLYKAKWMREKYSPGKIVALSKRDSYICVRHDKEYTSRTRRRWHKARMVGAELIAEQKSAVNFNVLNAFT